MSYSLAMGEGIPQILEVLYRTESRRILATLIRLLGDFDRAEDALHDAFRAALESWTDSGVPDNPTAWLISTGRFKAIDRMRRGRLESPLETAIEPVEPIPEEAYSQAHDFPDDRLRLIFTCCHPSLPPETRSALTLREVCGLTTEEIARAFLTTPATLAQRIVRAKNKIRDEHIPYEVPSAVDLPARLDAVLQVIYLVFNEGYSASAGDSLTRADVSTEAIRLGRLLLELLPEPEVQGLLALMLLHESRRTARATSDGDLILLDHQNRSLWNREQIQEGITLVEQALKSRRFGTYTVQAAIAAVHAEAERFEKTDWRQIVALYDVLMQMHPSPVIELNRAAAIAMRDGPAVGLAMVDDLLARGELDNYHLIYSVRADLYRRLGQKEAARSAYQQALTQVKQEPERRFLEKRLQELD
jgi:RNA polymerase sigma-70 factor, ECF subfamily